MDGYLGRILNLLRINSLENITDLVLVSDHGMTDVDPRNQVYVQSLDAVPVKFQKLNRILVIKTVLPERRMEKHISLSPKQTPWKAKVTPLSFRLWRFYGNE